MRQRGDERRQAMVAAALELVGERGPNAVTLTDVGQRVGTSHAAVLYHFRTRRELLLAVLEERDRRARTLLERCFSKGGLVALRRLAELGHGIQREPNFTRLAHVLQAESLEDDRVGRYFRARNQYIRRGLARAMRIGQERGEVRRDLDVDARAAQVAAFIFGIAQQHFVDPEGVDVVTIYADFVRQLVESIATRKAGAAVKEVDRSPAGT
ncbi:MAG TPA: TetR/AcrR family transcriptional regulator [Candidatus Dormibacteraeota bacterium]